MRIVSWNVYDAATQEMRYMPTKDIQEDDIDFFKKEKLLVTPRLDDTCLGQYDENHLPYWRNARNVYAPLEHNKKNVNQECTLKWVQLEGNDKWDNVWHEYSKKDGEHWVPHCKSTPTNVTKMAWKGKTCSNVLPTQTVLEWTQARHRVIADAVREMLTIWDIICLQEVSPEQYTMLSQSLTPVEDFDLIADWDETKARKWNTSPCDRSNVVIFNKKKYELLKYSNVWDSDTHCRQVCGFLEKESNIRATVINVHLYVPHSPKRPNGEILEELAKKLELSFADDDFLLIIGDMNLRIYNPKEDFAQPYKPTTDLWSGSVSQSLDHAFVQRRKATEIHVKNRSRQARKLVRKIAKRDDSIGRGLDADSKQLQKWYGPGYVQEVEDYRHWLSDHCPIALEIKSETSKSRKRIETSKSRKRMKITNPETSNSRKRLDAVIDKLSALKIASP